MQFARHGRGGRFGHVNRDNGLLPTALGFFHAARAARFRSDARKMLIIAPNPEVGEP